MGTSRLPGDVLSPALRFPGSSWHWLQESIQAPFWGFKPPFRHLRSDFILQNLVASLPLAAKLSALLELQDKENQVHFGKGEKTQAYSGGELLDVQGGIFLLIPRLILGALWWQGRLSRAGSLRVVSPAALGASSLHLFTWLPCFMVVYVII